jgi:stress-induced morphogen
MITADELTSYIRSAMPDADVTVVDRTGTLDHFTVSVVSDAFKGVNPLDRHRMVYKALEDPRSDGRIHALELKTETRS